MVYKCFQWRERGPAACWRLSWPSNCKTASAVQCSVRASERNKLEGDVCNKPCNSPKHRERNVRVAAVSLAVRKREVLLREEACAHVCRAHSDSA
eukprot:360046-Chlamydomonas_euryale.AAC.3